MTDHARSETPAIALTALGKTFGPTVAVDSIDLTIGRGEVVALLGPNGAGKSTTIDMLLGLLRPASGQVEVFGDTPEKATRTGRVGAMLQTGGLLQQLIVTTFGRPGYLRKAMEAGATGFVVKDAPAEQLADAIRRVHAGLRVVDPVLAAETLAAGASPLTARETDVLRAGRGGASVAEIARALFLSKGTVRNYLSSAIGKTHARNRVEALQVAEENGWL